MEKAMTVPALARRYGYSQHFIRCMCHREQNPIPHVKSGARREVLWVRADAFEQWVREEEMRNAG